MEVLQRTANRGSISGYDIANSLKLENDNAEQLYYTPASAGNLQTWTYSCWFKRTELSYNMMLFGANNTYVYLEADDTLKLRFTGTYVFDTFKEFRDTSAWYHIVVAVDTTQATQADRVKVYFNGEDHAGLFENDSFPAQNTNTDWNNTLVHYVAGWGTASFNPSCYLAEVHNVDGQQLTASDFGEFDEDTGIWKPKAYTGSYGTNGFFLEFQNGADLGEVSAGTQQTFVKSNITSADQATDTPTNNFAIYNQLIPKDEFEIYQGATRAKKTTTNRWRTMASTLAVANGKWYAEFQNSLYSTTGTARFVGVAPASIFTETFAATGGYLGGNSTETTDSIGYHSDNGQRYINGSAAAYGDSWTTNEIIGVALDMDNGYVYFSKNGTWQNSGDPTSGPSGTGGIALQKSGELHYIAGSIYDSNAQLEVNYGGFTVISIASGNADSSGYGNFEYAPPSGYYALCSKNLAEFG